MFPKQVNHLEHVEWKSKSRVTFALRFTSYRINMCFAAGSNIVKEARCSYSPAPATGEALEPRNHRQKQKEIKRQTVYALGQIFQPMCALQLIGALPMLMVVAKGALKEREPQQSLTSLRPKPQAYAAF